MRTPRISDRAASYGFKGVTVDGNDVLAVYEAARAAVEECRGGQGPYLLELLTYRRTGHSRRDACHDQPKEDRNAWFARDPSDQLARYLQDQGLIDTSGLAEIQAGSRPISRRWSKRPSFSRSHPGRSATDVFA